MAILIAVLAGILAQSAARASVPPDQQLLRAARLGDGAGVRQSIAAGAAVDGTDPRGYSPLMWAAASGSLDAARVLIEKGAQVGVRAADGTTALYLAAANGAAEVVTLLLAHGANPVAARGKETPRQIAGARGHPRIERELQQAESLGRALLISAEEGQADRVRALLTQRAPVNISDAGGATPLMLAARTGSRETVELLVDGGGDVLARDRGGRTAVDFASSTATRQYLVSIAAERTARQPARGSQTPAPPAVTESLRALAELLAKSTPAAASRAVSAVAQLQMLAAKWPADTPADYRASLAADARELGALRERPGFFGSRLAPAALDALADGLEAKLEHCLASGGRLGGSVLVRVRTVQGAAEAGRWQVFYMPKIFEVSPTAAGDLFPQLSSPTDDLLVPGRYLMWVRNPATGAVGERTVVKVGEGRKELRVDLPVPPAPAGK